MDPSFESESMDYQNYHCLSHNSFQKDYHCFKSDKEIGDKILMPQSALRSLVASGIQSPILFELRNPKNNRVSHCGVLEFTADECLIILPSWMMENMKLKEGDIAIVKSVRLENGSYVKLQPHTKEFVELSNPKAVLETQLRSFSCLTAGDTIMVMHNNKKYYINILETRPSSAICIIDTDCEVDFAPPLDYKEPEKPVRKVTCNAQEKPVEKEIKVKPFIGVARRLDGKPVAADFSSMLEEKQQVSKNKHVIESHKESTKVLKDGVKGEEIPKKSEQKFQAFTGKSFKLTV